MSYIFTFIEERIRELSNNNSQFPDSVLAQDQILISHSCSRILERALTAYIPNVPTNTIEQQINEEYFYSFYIKLFPASFRRDQHSDPLNVFSRVAIAAAKYPTDAIIRNYNDLQTWFYQHANKHAPADLCQSLTRMYLNHTDHDDYHRLLNLQLLCTEIYQTIGHTDQAYCQYYQTETLANKSNNARTTMNHDDIVDRVQKQKKLDNIGMKLEFQSEFKCNLNKIPKHQTSRKFSLL